ncbi:protein Star-like [Daphnia carinata]|uniref:protein Star-like n=1 Tax=Daphnia carinata TaxID=120202 RepID=UPI0028692D42|nr:protein Star-like [Daphnia carinata]
MKCHLKILVRGKYPLSLVILVGISLLFYKMKKRDNQVANAPPPQYRNSTSAENRYYNLMNNSDPSEAPFIDDHCNEGYVNSHQLQQDHPCVIDIIRCMYLHSPSSTNGSALVERAGVSDPSAGQSSIVLPYLNNKTDGFFVECGAGDGETLSNTYYMEKQLKWQGVLIEADRKSFGQILTSKRQCYALPVCLSLKPYPTEVAFYEDGLAGEIYGDKISNQEEITTSENIVNVQCFPLYSILLAVGRTQVDYFSVDVEGSESQILMSIPWHKVDIKTLTVEVTSRRQVDVQSLTRYMEKQNYKKVGLMAGLGYYDLIFVQNKEARHISFDKT